MPIEQFAILNKGPIKRVSCDKVPALMVIAGPNGVGKSTLLETLKRNIPSIREANVQIKATASGPPLYVAPHRIFVSHEVHKLLPLLVSRKFRDTQRSESLPGLPGYWGGLPPYLTSGVVRARNQPDFAPSDIKRRIGEIDFEFNRALRALHDKMGEVPKGALPKDVYRPLRDFVERFLHLRLAEIKLEGDFYKIYFINRSGDRVEYNTLSSGEQDALAMVFPFIEKRIENELARATGESLPNEDIIVLIDGPEEYLHPHLQRAFMAYLRQEIEEANKRGEKLQFIIATHSPTIVNEAETEELYVMLFPDQVHNGNQLIRVTEEKEKLVITKEFLGDLSVLATGKPLLILEGPQDVDLLKIFFPDIDRRFALRYLRGKREIEKLIVGLREIIPELWYKGLKMFAILDRDREDVKAKDRLGIVHVLPTTCIENLLLNDLQAIYEALKVQPGYQRLKEAGINSIQDLKKLIEEMLHDQILRSEELKRRVGGKINIEYDLKGLDIASIDADKLKHAIITESLEPRIQRFLEKVRTEAEKINETLRDPARALREFSGKLILGKLSSRFSIERDVLAREIANQMRNLGRVPKELDHIIREIEKTLEK